jgi:hypothetical protein
LSTLAYDVFGFFCNSLRGNIVIFQLSFPEMLQLSPNAPVANRCLRCSRAGAYLAALPGGLLHVARRLFLAGQGARAASPTPPPPIFSPPPGPRVRWRRLSCTLETTSRALSPPCAAQPSSPEQVLLLPARWLLPLGLSGWLWGNAVTSISVMFWTAVRRGGVGVWGEQSFTAMGKRAMGVRWVREPPGFSEGPAEP